MLNTIASIFERGYKEKMCSWCCLHCKPAEFGRLDIETSRSHEQGACPVRNLFLILYLCAAGVVCIVSLLNSEDLT